MKTKFVAEKINKLSPVVSCSINVAATIELTNMEFGSLIAKATVSHFPQYEVVYSLYHRMWMSVCARLRCYWSH